MKTIDDLVALITEKNHQLGDMRVQVIWDDVFNRPEVFARPEAWWPQNLQLCDAEPDALLSDHVVFIKGHIHEGLISRAYRVQLTAGSYAKTCSGTELCILLRNIRKEITGWIVLYHNGDQAVLPFIYFETEADAVIAKMILGQYP